MKNRHSVPCNYYKIANGLIMDVANKSRSEFSSQTDEYSRLVTSSKYALLVVAL